MIVDRVFTPGLAQVAYFVADEAAGEVAVIDPRRDVEAYVAWAVARGLRIVAILETHIHADFVSGCLELAAATGAPIYTSRIGEQIFNRRPLDHGDEIAIGALKLRAVWTPGHTPEHLCYLLIDPELGPVPIAIFTGDTLFVGEVGRPDLLGEMQTRKLAEQLYYTVTDRLSTLHDTVVVYPGHTAGSACGKKIGAAPHTSIGQERLSNYAFQARSAASFMRMVLTGMPNPPTYYPVLKRVNKAGAPLVETLPQGEAFTSAEFAIRQQTGALVIDTRSPDTFGQGHIPEAVFAGLGSSFTTWMGWLAPYDHDLILVLDADDQFASARTELRRIGLDRVAGYLAGGMRAWSATGRATATLPQWSVHDLARHRELGQDALRVLDVRTAEELDDGHIAGASHIFAGDILQGADPPIDATVPVAVICGSGYRSSVVSSSLLARGHRNLVNIRGGMGAWNNASLPVTT
ncbi:MBL fold hydrolase [soil metagenome]